jgi:hypothetical protein
VSHIEPLDHQVEIPYYYKMEFSRAEKDAFGSTLLRLKEATEKVDA